MQRSSTTLRILIWILFLFDGAVIGIWADLACCPLLFRNPYFHLISLLFGLWLMRLVINASRNTGRYLAKFGRQGDIPKFETNRLVTTGYYACMRHPMHFGLLFFPLAWALIVGSITFIVIIAPAEMLLIILMIKQFEEKEALRKFGKAYLEYSQKTPMFSLNTKCLKALFSKNGIEIIKGKS